MTERTEPVFSNNMEHTSDEDEQSVHTSDLIQGPEKRYSSKDIKQMRSQFGLNPDNIELPEIKQLDIYTPDKQSSVGAEKKKKSQENTDREETLAWYRKAKQKADSFIKDIDPAFSVDVDEVEIRLLNEDVVNGIVLRFNHANDRSRSFTMSIQMSDEYLDQEFEKILRGGQDEKYEQKLNQENHDDFIEFGTQEFEELKEKERDKTGSETAILQLANRITNQVRKAYGLKPINVPDRVTHVIKKTEWTGSAVYFEEINAIAIREVERLLIFKKKAIHEMLHLKSRNILPKAFNEALTEELTIECFGLIEDDSITENEILEFEAIRQRYPDAKALDGSPLFTKNTYVAFIDSEGTLHAEEFTYQEGRLFLNIFAEKIVDKARGIFRSPEEVKSLLGRANFLGDKELLNFIDQICGEGTLQQLYDAGENTVKLMKVLEKL